jgi:hypothetical protein
VSRSASCLNYNLDMFVDKVCIVHTPQLGYSYPVLLIPLSGAYRPDSMPC